jgi:hypothetical protein
VQKGEAQALCRNDYTTHTIVCAVWSLPHTDEGGAREAAAARQCERDEGGRMQERGDGGWMVSASNEGSGQERVHNAHVMYSLPHAGTRGRGSPENGDVEGAASGDEDAGGVSTSSSSSSSLSYRRCHLLFAFSSFQSWSRHRGLEYARGGRAGGWRWMVNGNSNIRKNLTLVIHINHTYLPQYTYSMVLLMNFLDFLILYGFS